MKTPPDTAQASWRGGWLSTARQCPSPNFGPRPTGVAIDLIVIHSISLPPGVYGGPQVEQLFTNQLDWNAHPYFEQIRGMEVSSHFFVRRDGEVVQFVDADARAWHAGRSCWRGRPNCNDDSIGIELEGLEGHTFEPAQYRTLQDLCTQLARFTQRTCRRRIEEREVGRVAHAEAAAAARDVALGVSVAEDVPLALAPRGVVDRVVDELLGNALAYARSYITVSVARDGASVRIDVEDDGPGVPESAWERIFTPFLRLARNAGVPQRFGRTDVAAHRAAHVHAGSRRVASGCTLSVYLFD